MKYKSCRKNKKRGISNTESAEKKLIIISIDYASIFSLFGVTVKPWMFF